jgi:hypothetical protein
VLPSLAVCVGLNEAIVLQQIHYWLRTSQNIRDGHRWVYNTYEQWREDNFPFWSVRTLQRIFARLEKKGFVISCSFNAHKWNQVKWYRINYARLYEGESLSIPDVEVDTDKLSIS